MAAPPTIEGKRGNVDRAALEHLTDLVDRDNHRDRDERDEQDGDRVESEQHQGRQRDADRRGHRDVAP